MNSSENELQFIEAVLRGIPTRNGERGIDPGIVGPNVYETQQMRAEWCVKMLPWTANHIGVEWDGKSRLTVRKDQR
jgi:hypothetical protein